MSNYVHTIGINPETKETLLPEFPLSDKFWEENEDAFGELRACRTINSQPSPFEGDTIPFGLQFILKSSNHFEDEESVVGEINDTGGVEKMSYNVTLRLLRDMAVSKNLWFGILPEARSSETWRYFRNIPDEEKTELDYAIAPNQIESVFSEHPESYEPTAVFPCQIHIAKSFTVKVPETTQSKAWDMTLPEEIPFVAIILREDDIYNNSWDVFPIVANRSFKELCSSDPSRADELFKNALEDAFHYQSQDSDQQFCDWETFIRDQHTNISERFNPKAARTACLKKLEKMLRREIRKLIAKEIVELYPEILHGDKNHKLPKLHIKSFKFGKSGIHLDATVETPQKVVKMKLSPEATTWETTMRNRKDPTA